MKQMSTVRREVPISGTGIHSGKHVNVLLKPYSLGRIVFRRTDLDNLEIPLKLRNIQANNSSSLVSKGCRIQTLEHLLAVLHIFGINSLLVEMDGSEIPIGDGSASLLAKAVHQAGLKALPGRRKSLKIEKNFAVREKEASVSFFPDNSFRISYCIEFDHPAIMRQEKSFVVDRESFLEQIAPARTFGFLKDVVALRQQGLALGGSLENALVLDEEGVINGPLHFPDEFVRHKILDFLGDLSLVGRSLIGHFKAYKAGHALHLKAVRLLLENRRYWSYV
jgi:UDP-3-O-[3-hydroxymyristoyl] N-acetylglucosamine deacetylase